MNGIVLATWFRNLFGDIKNKFYKNENYRKSFNLFGDIVA
jgi:hypothetical protein